jgi:hypothetical protein
METCSSGTSDKSTQIQKHSNITSGWKKMLEFMVKVSVQGTATTPYTLRTIKFSFEYTLLSSQQFSPVIKVVNIRENW